MNNESDLRVNIINADNVDIAESVRMFCDYSQEDINRFSQKMIEVTQSCNQLIQLMASIGNKAAYEIYEIFDALRASTFPMREIDNKKLRHYYRYVRTYSRGPKPSRAHKKVRR